MNDALLLQTQEDGIVTLTLNRPQHYNALSSALLQTLQDRLEQVADDASARVLILAASGRAFCAGHDLHEIDELAPHTNASENLFRQCSRVMLTLTRMPQPVIAQVQGVATAAGCQLVAACDLAVASENARFAVSGVNLGLFCSTPAVALSRNLGRKRAMQMLLSGEFIDAPTAAAWGLVNEVVPAADLIHRTHVLAQQLSTKNATALALGKQAFYRQLEYGLEDAYQLANGVMAENLLCPNTQAGIQQFLHRT